MNKILSVLVGISLLFTTSLLSSEKSNFQLSLSTQYAHKDFFTYHLNDSFDYLLTGARVKNKVSPDLTLGMKGLLIGNSTMHGYTYLTGVESKYLMTSQDYIELIFTYLFRNGGIFYNKDERYQLDFRYAYILGDKSKIYFDAYMSEEYKSGESYINYDLTQKREHQLLTNNSMVGALYAYQPYDWFAFDIGLYLPVYQNFTHDVQNLQFSLDFFW